jgi:hypothetical protein
MTTTVVSILNRAARRCSVVVPSSWLGSVTEVQQEIRDDFLLDTVHDIQDRMEMVGPIGKTVTITGDGSETYGLPADFHRLKRDDFAVYENTATRRRCYPVTTDGEWEYLKDIGSAGGDRFYRLRGYPGAWSIDFYRNPAATDAIIVSYVSTVWTTNGGTEKSAFTDAADVSLLPRRLLETGIVWRFRDRKGLSYMDALNEYEMLLARFVNDSRGARTVDMAPGTSRRGPFDIPVPDIIPSS